MNTITRVTCVTLILLISSSCPCANAANDDYIHPGLFIKRSPAGRPWHRRGQIACARDFVTGSVTARGLSEIP